MVRWANLVRQFISAQTRGILFTYCYISGRKKDFVLSPVLSLLNLAVVGAGPGDGPQTPNNAIDITCLHPLKISQSQPLTPESSKSGSKAGSKEPYGDEESGSRPKRKVNELPALHLLAHNSAEVQEALVKMDQFHRTMEKSDTEKDLTVGWIRNLSTCFRPHHKRRKVTRIRTIFDDENHTAAALGRSLSSQQQMLEYLM